MNNTNSLINNSQTPRPKYKKTKIGAIPKNWKVKEIGEIADVKGGKRLPAGGSLVDEITPHPYIRVTDMYLGGVHLDNLKYVPEDIFPNIKNYTISSQDIFISVAGTLGIVGTIPNHIDGANLTENADKITNIKCDRDFLLYSLMSQRIQSTIDAQKTIGAQPKLALERIKTFLVAIPPEFEEQCAIAEVLSDVDALIAALDRLIAKKRAIKQGAMQELLTGKTRLPGFSGEWEVKKLGDILEYEQPTEYLVENDEYKKTGTPVLTPGKTFVLGYTDEQKGIYTKHPAIIFDDFTTASKYVDFPFKVKSSAIKLLRPRNERTDLRFVFGKMQILQFHVGDHKRHYISEYQHVDINVPSSPEQHAIANVLRDMDAEIEALETRRDKTLTLKEGMMQELLTGKTRLI